MYLYLLVKVILKVGSMKLGSKSNGEFWLSYVNGILCVVRIIVGGLLLIILGIYYFLN